MYTQAYAHMCMHIAYPCYAENDSNLNPIVCQNAPFNPLKFFIHPFTFFYVFFLLWKWWCVCVFLYPNHAKPFNWEQWTSISTMKLRHTHTHTIGKWTNEGHISIEHNTKCFCFFFFAAYWFNYIPIELVVNDFEHRHGVPTCHSIQIQIDCNRQRTLQFQFSSNIQQKNMWKQIECSLNELSDFHATGVPPPNGVFFSLFRHSKQFSFHSLKV